MKFPRFCNEPALAAVMVAVALFDASRAHAQDIAWCHCRIQDRFEIPFTGSPGFAARRTFGTPPFRMEHAACQSRATYRRFAQYVEEQGFNFHVDIKGKCMAFDTRSEALVLLPADNPPFRGWIINWDGK